ncbi:hypothetical protein Leryth_014499 [Lithospermum erythrorhizon]|nr:hypothetical protein Leryth_014499 [Lithospermum erythrorhizon]
MAEICCGLVKETEASPPYENSRAARRRRMEMRRFKVSSTTTTCTNNHSISLSENGVKRQRILEIYSDKNGVDNVKNIKQVSSQTEIELTNNLEITLTSVESVLDKSVMNPKYGTSSVCGRRRDMEDAVAVHPSFCRTSEFDDDQDFSKFHFFGVYDGHGCSHVAMKCRQRLHDLVKEEVSKMNEEVEELVKWKNALEKSFIKMEEEIIAWNKSMVGASCRCELQTPECDAVGSTAVVAILTPFKIIVANVGDSRAILCRNAQPVPLSIDHKPDRPDELNRIQAAGGRVIYWDGARVQGMLAMSRAIGDNYLKPYVICEPEVTITDRSDDDECLIIASDGLWDVVSNETACGVVRMCLKGKAQMCLKGKGPGVGVPGGGASCSSPSGRDDSDKACSDASMLLTKLALARRSADNVSVVVIDLRKET